ncbi:MAG: mechanosensitive ion channel family protein [Anaerolineae bacterium]
MPDISLFLTWGGIIVGAAILLFVILHWWACRTPNDVDDVVVGVLQWPVMLFLLLTATADLVNYSTLPPELQATIYTIVNVLRIIVTTWTAWRLMRDTVLYYGRQLAKRSDSSFDDVLIPVLDVLAPVVIVSIGALLMLRLLGADISTVVLTTGGAAVIVGLALRDTMGNILGGLTLLIDTPFRFGDLIILDNVVCEIRRIGLRVTTLYNTEEHSEIYVPNCLLAAGKITNLTRPSPDLRVALEVTIPDDVPLAQADACLQEAANANPYILGDLDAKLAAMHRSLEGCDPESSTAKELRWGITALSSEQSLDDELNKMAIFLRDLHVVLGIVQKNGLSASEKAAIAKDLAGLNDCYQGIKVSMQTWAKARTQDPHLQQFAIDQTRLIHDSELQILALDRRIRQMQSSFMNPSLFESQRLDDMVAEFNEWLPKAFKLVTPAWKYPLVASMRSSVTSRQLHLVVFVDDIQLEGFTRRPRTLTALNEAIGANMIELHQRITKTVA